MREINDLTASRSLLDPTAGVIRLNGEEIAGLSGSALRARRRDFQIIFQDPYSSLNPRMRVKELLGEPMAIWMERNPHKAATCLRFSKCRNRPSEPRITANSGPIPLMPASRAKGARVSVVAEAYQGISLNFHSLDLFEQQLETVKFAATLRPDMQKMRPSPV
ncbi:ABC-type dipeptide/oligopeptide/nickel transport system ATPase subunit [Sinorhizobium kostiense]|uniref:ABC-type dipeptide/oligopeptide/nickel transport system ATPase subunit n=1 Tax=Sinorhizobium kostiense TaxID=76747 RepID=A0ABS4R7Z9_9HYPH|nr:ABC-type dipeptide/oligopeptide/nickel transport system ATPase subunit [Sinorhizobium kostiense]